MTGEFHYSYETCPFDQTVEVGGAAFRRRL